MAITVNHTSNITAVRQGANLIYTTIVSGAPANTTLEVEYFMSSATIGDMSASKNFVLIDANGTGKVILTLMDTGVVPRGQYSTYAKVGVPGSTDAKTLSNTLIITYEAGTASPTPAPTPIPTPAPGTSTALLTVSKSVVVSGDTQVFNISATGLTPNASMTATLYTQSSSLNNSVEQAIYTGTIAANSTGVGALSFSTADNGVVPRGVYIYWVIISNGARSPNVSVIYSASSTTPAPTPSPSPSPGPTPSPTPSPSPGPTPAPTPAPGTGMKFVALGQVASDLLQSVSLKTATGLSLAQALARPQVCDYTSTLSSSIQSNEEESLGKYIRDNLRNNASDNTKLKPYLRSYFNAPSVAKTNSTRAYSAPTQTYQRLSIGSFTDMVPYLGTTVPGFVVEDGILRFNKKGKYLINIDLNVCLWAAATTLAAQTTNPVWRYGSNIIHEVSWTVQMVFKGSLSDGQDEYVIPLVSSYILQNHVIDKYTQRVGSTYLLQGFDGTAPLGRIDTVEFRIVRGGWVATYEGIQDKIGFFKTTDAGTTDTSNYLEIIEL